MPVERIRHTGELPSVEATRVFSRAIERAIASVNSSGLDAADHFRGVPKLIEVGKGGKRQVEDVELTRYGCYVQLSIGH